MKTIFLYIQNVSEKFRIGFRNFKNVSDINILVKTWKKLKNRFEGTTSCSLQRNISNVPSKKQERALGV